MINYRVVGPGVFQAWRTYKLTTDGTASVVSFVAGFNAARESKQQPSKEDKPPSFLFKGIEITNPHLSECGRFTVDPEEYYGAVYLEWRLCQMS